LGLADAANCPVILIADIDRGGVFANIVGTLALLSESELQRVIGFVINHFRGDIALLQSGLDWLEAETGKPVFDVLPYLHGLHIEAEDAVPSNISNTNISAANIDTANNLSATNQLKIIVPILPHFSNHTDYDALRLNSHVNFQFVKISDNIPLVDLIILSGSKNVRGDLAHLR